MSYTNDLAQDIDLYQARMLIAYYKAGMSNVTGTMEAFTRKMPANRRFMVACGVERIFSHIKNVFITRETIEIFKQVLLEIDFDDDLCEYLLEIDFAESLTIRAMDDGEIFFANQPVISITGPIGIVQYIEKKVLDILNHDVRIASKCARISIAAGGRPVAEFGGRRGCLGPEAGRAAYIAGFTSTSNVLAFSRYGIPCSGTMGHVFVMSFLGKDGEAKAYKTWGDMFPKSTFLPDTYNLMQGVDKVLDNCSKNIGSIRLDVDDLKNASYNVKRKLNQRDHFDVQIGATNDLNEYKIKALLDHGCPIDWFGVGTEAVCTPDAPTCNFVFKLVEVNDPNLGIREAVAKLSDGGKGTLPGAKQVFRHFTEHLYLGNRYYKYSHDEIGLADEQTRYAANNLLKDQNIFGPRMTAQRSRDFFLSSLRAMPDHVKVISENDICNYDVILSDKMQNEVREFKIRHSDERLVSASR